MTLTHDDFAVVLQRPVILHDDELIIAEKEINIPLAKIADMGDEIVVDEESAIVFSRSLNLDTGTLYLVSMDAFLDPTVTEEEFWEQYEWRKPTFYALDKETAAEIIALEDAEDHGPYNFED